MTEMVNDTAARFYSMVARGLNMSANGAEQQRIGQSLANVGLVMLLKDRSNDAEAYKVMLRHCMSVHLDARSAPEAFAATMAYWTDTLRNSGKDGKNIDFAIKTAKNEKHVATRREDNEWPAAQIRTLRTAASVAFAFDAMKLDWSGVTDHAKQAGILLVSPANALRLFPDKDKSISKEPQNIVVNTFGVYNWKALVSIGNEALVKANVRKAPPPRAGDKVKPLRDLAAEIGKAVEAADVKAFDKTTRLASFSALVAMVDALNNTQVEGHIPNDVVRPLREWLTRELDKAAAESEAKIKTAAANAAGVFTEIKNAVNAEAQAQTKTPKARVA